MNWDKLLEIALIKPNWDDIVHNSRFTIKKRSLILYVLFTCVLTYAIFFGPNLIPIKWQSAYYFIASLTLVLYSLVLFLNFVRFKHLHFLNSKKKELVDINEELTMVNYMTSHDLMEPLRHITSQASDLEETFSGTVLSDEQKELVTNLNKSAIRAVRIVKDLMSFTKVSRATFIPETLSIQEIVDAAMSNLNEVQAAFQKNQFQITLSGPTKARFNGDRTNLTLLVQNLISNAFKFREKASGALPTVNIEAHVSSDFVRISVRDNGMGMTAYQLSQAGKPFKRFHGEAIQGSGMGLSICKRISERMGGSLVIAHNVPKGLSVSAKIPNNTF